MARPLLSKPTFREAALVLVLLIFAIIFSQYTELFGLGKHYHDAHYKSAKGHITAEKSANVSRSYSSYPAPKLSWKDTVPETKLVLHVAGFTIFDNLYVLNGTIFIVTSKPKIMPELSLITSSGHDILSGSKETNNPSERDIRIVTPQEAHNFFSAPSSIPLSAPHSNMNDTNINGAALRIDGVNWLISDSPQFIPHYDLFASQMLLAMWRTYSSLDPTIQESGQTTLPPPRRLLMTHVSSSKWRDQAGLNELVVHGSFPMIGMEFSEDWNDRARMNVPFVFDRVLIADRAASNNGQRYKDKQRSGIDPIMDLNGSPNFWSTIRNNMLEFCGGNIAAEWINAPDPGRLNERKKYVITYLSRQGQETRSLVKKDHESLVKELKGLGDRNGYEINVVDMEKLPRAEQILLAGRTTILMGVHGSSFSAMLWMRPSGRATIMEFFYQDGYSSNNDYTARAVRIMYIGFWNNDFFLSTESPDSPNFPDGFDSNEISIDGKLVGRLVQHRLIYPSKRLRKTNSVD